MSPRPTIFISGLTSWLTEIWVKPISFAIFATAFGVQNWHGPVEVMGEIGVKPTDVTDIFITHAHFDHIGDTDSFPNATFYMQERELSKWIWAMAQHCAC